MISFILALALVTLVFAYNVYMSRLSFKYFERSSVQGKMLIQSPNVSVKEKKEVVASVEMAGRSWIPFIILLMSPFFGMYYAKERLIKKNKNRNVGPNEEVQMLREEFDSNIGYSLLAGHPITIALAFISIAVFMLISYVVICVYVSTCVDCSIYEKPKDITSFKPLATLENVVSYAFQNIHGVMVS